MQPQALQNQLLLFIPSGAAQILRKIECKNLTQIPSSVLCSVKQAEMSVQGGTNKHVIWKRALGYQFGRLGFYVTGQLYFLSLQIEDRGSGIYELLLRTYQKMRCHRREGYKITGSCCEIVIVVLLQILPTTGHYWHAYSA